MTLQFIVCVHMDMLHAYFMTYIWRSEDKLKELVLEMELGPPKLVAIASTLLSHLAGLSVSLSRFLSFVVVNKHLLRDRSDFLLFILRWRIYCVAQASLELRLALSS